MWSIGVILYILLGGYLPFPCNGNGDNIQAQIDAIGRDSLQFHQKYWRQISKEAIELVSKLLVINPENRYTCAQALNHPFTRSVSRANLAGTKAMLIEFHEQQRKQAIIKNRWQKIMNLVWAMNTFKLAGLQSKTSFQLMPPEISTENHVLDQLYTLGTRYLLALLLLLLLLLLLFLLLLLLLLFLLLTTTTTTSTTTSTITTTNTTATTSTTTFCFSTTLRCSVVVVVRC